MLTIVTGRSRRLWPLVLEEIGEALRAGGERLYLITPDQYTLQAELDLVDRLHLKGLLQVEVLSPSRLLTRVFTLAGSPQRVRIDTRGKGMVLADVIHENTEALVYYGGAAKRIGFAERLSGSIADFKRAGMTPQDVLAAASALPDGDPLGGKFQDLALLYARYEARLAGQFIDGEDAQEALLARLPKSGLLTGARLWIYGFDLITPQFMREIAVMTEGADAVRLMLTCEADGAPDAAAFAPARGAIDMLIRYFASRSIPWQQQHADLPLDAHPDIHFLERSLYAVPTPQRDAPVTAITLTAAANPYDEAMRAAAEILRLARSGMPFDAIAVTLGDAEGYAGAIETAFGRSGIPFHMARSRPAAGHPLIRAWLAALRTVTTQWRRQEDALDWLKGGFSGLTVEEAETLENYAIEHGLRGAKWKRPIADPALELLRERFAEPLFALQSRLRAAKDNTQSLSAAYELLEDVNAYDTLMSWQDMLTRRGLLAEASALAQAWRILMETLDQLHALLGGSRMRMDGMAQVVEAGFAQTELEVVPPSPGLVTVGAFGHAKLGSGIRALLLLGMQDGIMRQTSASLFTDVEAERGADMGLPEGAFGLRGNALAQLMQINLLDTIAAPRERLWISHAAANTGGDALRPAAWLHTLRRIFPRLTEQGGATSEVRHLHAPGAALDALGPMLRAAASPAADAGDAADALRAAGWLYHNPATYAACEQVLATLSAQPPSTRLAPAVAQGLYAHTRTSVSRLEAYARCPFGHFVTYGLRPKPRQPYAISPADTGTFYHRAMETYTSEVTQMPGWPFIPREESDTVMDRALAPLTSEWAATPLGDGAMMQAMADALCRVARRAGWTYTGQMQRGKFRTRRLEARFGPGEALPPIALHLADGRICHVEGRIDRIDFFEADGASWLRVVDYKSGGTALDLTRISGGLQLQLLLYLSAALSANPGVAPGGAFYARFDDPFIETDSRDVSEIENALAKALRLKGITLSDVRVAAAMEDGEGLLNKDGSFRKTQGISVLTAEELDALMAHARHMAQDIATQMQQGHIAVRPAQVGDWTACQWCDYRSICGFDPSLDGHLARTLDKADKRTFFGQENEG